MTRKIHLRRNKLTGLNSPLAFCAAKVAGPGKCRSNSRSTYRFMASAIVGREEFLAAPAADRCAHCVDAALIYRNARRREKGLAPVETLEGWGA